MDPLAAVGTRVTRQTEPADARQIRNAAGGHGFALDDDTRVHRFLTLGTDGGTYYAAARELTAGNAEVVLRAARERGAWLVERAVAVSVAGRAPRPNPAIFAVAAAAALADDEGRRAALDALGAVCRTGTHLFLFARYVEQFRGWGRGLRRAVGSWYLDRPVGDVAFQAVKYRQREGWSHRDLLRLAHPATDDPARRALFGWIVTGQVPSDATPALVDAFVRAQEATSVATWVRLVAEHPLSSEMLPDAALTQPAVWGALLDKGLPQTALMRQLPRLTRLGLLRGGRRRAVVAQLADPARLARARVHPVNVLVAARTYASGRSVRGEATWKPDRRVVDALDAAFYTAFGTAPPAGKRTLVALDVSGSMGAAASGLPVSCRDASAALALLTVATEPATDVVGFTAKAGGAWRVAALSELAISPRQRLDDVIRTISGLPFGGTDCALPMTWALEAGREFDTFVVYTDNETWAGAIHPHQALVRYRERTGIDAAGGGRHDGERRDDRRPVRRRDARRGRVRRGGAVVDRGLLPGIRLASGA